MAIALPTGWWLADTLRWRSPLYCIERPGTLWNGLTPLPSGLTPTCPNSASYRQEVRDGESRVEQYLVPGWQPLAAAETLRAKGYVLLDDELMAPDHYSAFMGKTLPAELHYTAVKQGNQTLITISGAPR
ncbi:hypothetical protein K7W42_18760 [Deinococcus sp. HMF7604]|uniref:hypothetical protein n=1 Tax=Deinococcus betulae TaxID=2873312 RepID=UPI001CC99C84|nr:hypothetical protein [Deinococcus betulae]